MAEWTGRRQGERSVVERRSGRREEDAGDRPRAPEAPGAATSPQVPGEVPDRSSVPGHHAVRVPRAKQVRRPLTEYGTAQAIMNVFAAPVDNPMDPARFEQATAAYEELRKAYPAELPPDSPVPGYALAEGDRMASELQAIEAGPTPSTPAAVTGEAASAAPGAPSPDAAGAVAAPARTEARAAQVGSEVSPSDAPASVRSPGDAAAGSGAVTDGGAAGQSRWAEAAPPKPGAVSGPAGTLPAAKDAQPDGQGGNRGGPDSPPLAPQ